MNRARGRARHAPRVRKTVMHTRRALIAVVTCSLVLITAAQTAAQTGPVAAYGFDEGTGTTAADATGNGRTGTISGATWNSSGRFGSSLTFDGVNDRVNIADHALLDLTTGMTLEAWVRPSALGASWRTVILKEQTAQLVYALYAHTDTSRPSGHVYIGGDIDVRGTAQVALDAWTHLAATYDGATLRLYANGTLAASRAIAGSMVASTAPLRFGGNAVWPEWFAGLIDEIRIYNRALSAAEIQTDMQRSVTP